MVNITVLTIVYAWVGGLLLWLANQLLSLIGNMSTASFAKGSAYHAMVQGATLRYIKPGLYSVLGQDGRFSYKLEHILLMAILATLIGISRTVYIAAELLRRIDRSTRKSAEVEDKGDNKKAK